MNSQQDISYDGERLLNGQTEEDGMAELNNKSIPPEESTLPNESEPAATEISETTQNSIQYEPEMEQKTTQEKDGKTEDIEEETTGDADKQDTQKTTQETTNEDTIQEENQIVEDGDVEEPHEANSIGQAETDGVEGDIDREITKNSDEGPDTNRSQSVCEQVDEEEPKESNESAGNLDNSQTEARNTESPEPLQHEQSQLTQRSELEEDEKLDREDGTPRKQHEDNKRDVEYKENEEDSNDEGDNRDFTLRSEQEYQDSGRNQHQAEEDVYLETYRADTNRQEDEETDEQKADVTQGDTSLNEEPSTEHPGDASQQNHSEEQESEAHGETEQQQEDYEDDYDDDVDQREQQEESEDEDRQEKSDRETDENPQDHTQTAEDNDEEQEENIAEPPQQQQRPKDDDSDDDDDDDDDAKEDPPQMEKAKEEVDNTDPPGPTMEELKEHEEFSKKLDCTEDTSLSVIDRLDVIHDMLDGEREHLLQTPLKDYARLEKLSSVIHSSKVVCKHYETTMLQMSDKINKVNQAINAINATVDRKITNEGVLSWAEQLKTNPLDPESVAQEKELLSRAAEAREALGKASCEIPRAEERAAELTAQTVEAALTASKAQQAAEEARAAAEIAKKAAEQRRLEQEEAKRKAEEAKRQQEEIERLKREDEERKRREEELLTGGTEEERERIRKEVERRKPGNWPVWVFSVDPEGTGIPVGCVIRCLPDVTTRDLFSVEKVDQLTGVLPLEPNEELVSHIIKITHNDQNFKTMEPLCIAVPHCAPRNNSRETVVKMLQASGKWVEVGTTEAWFEDMREYKFSECRLQKVATLAVVTRIKREQHTVHKRGGKVVPSVDTRICFTVRQSMFKVSTTVTVEVFPVDSTLVADLRYRKENCESLLASSPMIRLHTPLKKFSKPVMVNVPLPQNPAKQKRPSTAAASKSAPEGQAKARPMSGFMSAFMSNYAKQHEDEDEDQVHLLTKDNEGMWVVVEGAHLVQPKNKDVVIFEMENPLQKFLVLRCKADVTFNGLERIATMMEEMYTERVVQVVLRQQDDDAASVLVHCDLVSRIEGIVKKLGDQGFNYGPLPSQDIVLHEGQPIKITFRGNVMAEEGQNLNFVYNSHIKTMKTIRVAVKDTFAQKSIDCYRGFCQISLPTAEAKPDDTSTSVFLKKQLKAELLINLPKPEPEAPKAIVERAPVQVKSDGLVDKDLLHQVAADLGEEWKRLAQQLNIKRMRVQAIIRNNVQKDTEHVIYEMLVTWMKRIPKSANKVEMLCNALLAIGRVDIAEVIRDKELDFKKEKALHNRDSYLRKAFVQIAQCPYIVSDWKFLGRQLDVREMEIAEVDVGYTSMREKCYHSLLKWREGNGAEATPQLLIETLKKCKYHHVADQVQETLKNAM